MNPVEMRETRAPVTRSTSSMNWIVSSVNCSNRQASAFVGGQVVRERQRDVGRRVQQRRLAKEVPLGFTHATKVLGLGSQLLRSDRPVRPERRSISSQVSSVVIGPGCRRPGSG